MPIIVTDLRFAYGPRMIFDRLSCRFQPGAMTGLVGPSGSGKSTLLALLMGQLSPDNGSITLPPELCRGGRVDASQVAWVMQTSNVFTRRPARDNVALPLRCGGVARHLADRAAVSALTTVGLGSRAHDRSGLLSGGERQRVAVARALATGAPLLIADEPTISLDHANRDLLVTALRSAAHAGSIVIVATHDRAVYDSCDALVML